MKLLRSNLRLFYLLAAIGLPIAAVAESNAWDARVIALATSNQNVATGFGSYALAKSIYFRFLMRGHEVTFPKDTLVQVQLATR